MGDRERRIRDEAYLMWVDAGRPEGDGQDYWIEAEKRVAETERAAGKDTGEPATKRGDSAPVVAKNAGNGAVAAPVAKPKAASKAAPETAPRTAPAREAPLKGAAVDVAPARAPRKPSAPVGRPKG